jgi:hypothetical protein
MQIAGVLTIEQRLHLAISSDNPHVQIAYAFQSANGVTLGNLAQLGANTVLSNWTGGTANVIANAYPSCTDSGGVALTSGGAVGASVTATRTNI